MTDENEPQKVLDAIRQQKIQSGLQPFKLVKYFSFSSLGVFLIFTLFLSWLISNHTRKIMLDQTEDYSLLLAENLNQQVFRRFVIPAVVRYGRIALSNPEQFEILDRIVRGFTQGLNIKSVTIFDSKVNVISYSTEEDLVGKTGVGGVEYQKSLAGETNSKLITHGSIASLLPGTGQINCILRTYIPFRQVRENGEPGEVIMGVIEIEKDLSKDYAAVINLQGRIIVVSGMVMAVLFLVLRTIVARGSEIMERRTMERLRLEEKLNQSERLAHLGSMVATVSHEIKSPLGIVRSTAEILEKRIAKVAPGNEHLAKIIVDETIRLNGIVMEFLDFARPQKIKKVQTNINDVVNKGLSFIEAQMIQQKIALRTDLCLDPALAEVDPELLYRALLNILVNGLQAMKADGLLSVQTKKASAGTGVIISISDNGIGMSERKIEHIFKPFFTDKHKGTGLGLAITQNIIENHDGQITVQSKENEGTTFRIILP
ncbi:MAG: ATP-binding protein [Desulfocapsaceae bacterium]|nr:ATP-binding protein [Desulfocapsaceae bacterium]